MEELAYRLGADFAEVAPELLIRSYEDAVVSGKADVYMEDAEGSCATLLPSVARRYEEEEKDKPSDKIGVLVTRSQDQLEATSELDRVAINPDEAYQRHLSIGKIEELGEKVLKNYCNTTQLLADFQVQKSEERNEKPDKEEVVKGEIANAFTDEFMNRLIGKYDFLEDKDRGQSRWSSRKEGCKYDKDLYMAARDNFGEICDGLNELERGESVERTPEYEDIVIDLMFMMIKEEKKGEKESAEKPEEYSMPEGLLKGLHRGDEEVERREAEGSSPRLSGGTVLDESHNMLNSGGISLKRRRKKGKA